MLFVMYLHPSFGELCFQPQAEGMPMGNARSSGGEISAVEGP
jgi:hypothetical protein